MSISSGALFSSLRKQQASVTAYKKEVDLSEKDFLFAKEAKEKISNEIYTHQKLDWTNHPNKELLDRIYALDLFKGDTPVYQFNSPQEGLPFLQKIEQFYSNQSHEFESKRNKYQEKKSAMEQYQQQVIQIIQQLNQCMSIVNR